MTAEAMQADAMFRALVEAIHDPSADADTAAGAWADALEEAHGSVPCPECPPPDDAEPHPADLPCQRCHGAGFQPHQRAEFVRVCVELERLNGLAESMHPMALVGADGMRREELLRRYHELLRAHEHEWRRAGSCPECGGTGRRDRPHRMLTPRDVTEPCSACQATGDRGGLLRVSQLKTGIVAKLNGGKAAPEFTHRVHWRRGVPDRVECTLAEVLVEQCKVCESSRYDAQARGGGCSYCEGGAGARGFVWRPTAWAKAVATGHPTLTGLTLTDRQPRSFGVGEWQWFRGGLRDQFGAWELPEPVFDALPASEIKSTDRFRRSYPTRAHAIEALGRAALAVCRAAGSPGA